MREDNDRYDSEQMAAQESMNAAVRAEEILKKAKKTPGIIDKEELDTILDKGKDLDKAEKENNPAEEERSLNDERNFDDQKENTADDTTNTPDNNQDEIDSDKNDSKDISDEDDIENKLEDNLEKDDTETFLQDDDRLDRSRYDSQNLSGPQMRIRTEFDIPEKDVDVTVEEAEEYEELQDVILDETDMVRQRSFSGNYGENSFKRTQPTGHPEEYEKIDDSINDAVEGNAQNEVTFSSPKTNRVFVRQEEHNASYDNEPVYDITEDEALGDGGYEELPSEFLLDNESKNITSGMSSAPRPAVSNAPGREYETIEIRGKETSKTGVVSYGEESKQLNYQEYEPLEGNSSETIHLVIPDRNKRYEKSKNFQYDYDIQENHQIPTNDSLNEEKASGDIFTGKENKEKDNSYKKKKNSNEPSFSSNKNEKLSYSKKGISRESVKNKNENTYARRHETMRVSDGGGRSNNSLSSATPAEIKKTQKGDVFRYTSASGVISARDANASLNKAKEIKDVKLTRNGKDGKVRMKKGELYSQKDENRIRLSRGKYLSDKNDSDNDDKDKAEDKLNNRYRTLDKKNSKSLSAKDSKLKGGSRHTGPLAKAAENAKKAKKISNLAKGGSAMGIALSAASSADKSGNIDSAASFIGKIKTIMKIMAKKSAIAMLSSTVAIGGIAGGNAYMHGRKAADSTNNWVPVQAITHCYQNNYNSPLMTQDVFDKLQDRMDAYLSIIEDVGGNNASEPGYISPITNPKTAIKGYDMNSVMPFMAQQEYPYCFINIPAIGKQVCSSGCSVVSYAMIEAYYRGIPDSDVNAKAAMVTDVANHLTSEDHVGGVISTTVFSHLAARYGRASEIIDVSQNPTPNKSLAKNGIHYMTTEQKVKCIISMGMGYPIANPTQGQMSLVGGGHYIAWGGIDTEGNVFVHNSNGKYSGQAFTISDMDSLSNGNNTIVYPSSKALMSADYSNVYDYRYYVTHNAYARSHFSGGTESDQIQAAAYFFTTGIANGDQASASFDIDSYMKNNPSIAEKYNNNRALCLRDYCFYGFSAGRSGVPSATLSSLETYSVNGIDDGSDTDVELTKKISGTKNIIKVGDDEEDTEDDGEDVDTSGSPTDGQEDQNLKEIKVASATINGSPVSPNSINMYDLGNFAEYMDDVSVKYSYVDSEENKVSKLSQIIGDTYAAQAGENVTNTASEGGTSSETDLEGVTDGSISDSDGTVIEIPDDCGQYYTYMGWQCITATTSTQYKLREESGENYDDDGFARINGRFVIACTSTYGTIGDYVDFELENGMILHCVIGDEKNQSDAGCTEWGHDGGKCVVEFIVDKSSWYNPFHANPGTTSCYPEIKSHTVRCANLGSWFDDPTLGVEGGSGMTGQKIFLKEMLSMSSYGSSSGNPISCQDYWDYCRNMADWAIAESHGAKVELKKWNEYITDQEGNVVDVEEHGSAKITIQVSVDPIELQKNDPTMKDSWDTTIEYGDRTVLSYMSLTQSQFQQVFGVDINKLKSQKNGLKGDEKKVYNFFKKKGLNDIQIAGILANIKEESNFDPEATNGESGAGGLFQWTGGRLTALKLYADTKGKDWTDFQTQLDYSWIEIHSPGSGWVSVTNRNQFLNTNRPYEAGYFFCKYWEREGSESENKARGELAEQYFRKIKSGSGTASDYVEYAIQLAEEKDIGYCQAHRTMYNVEPGAVDCSSLVYYSLVETGYDVGSADAWPFTTSSMGSVLVGAGFQQLAFTGEGMLQEGDILVAPGSHTEIYIGDGQNVGAHQPESGGVNCGQLGDQTGKEVSVGNYYNGGWSYVYRKSS